MLLQTFMLLPPVFKSEKRTSRRRRKLMKRKNKKIKTLKKNWPIFLLAAIMFSALFYLSFYRNTYTEKPIVVVIPSYNNAQWYKRNLDMLVAQEKNYKNWRAVYIDDFSTDGTGDEVEKYIKEKKFDHKIKLIKNKERHRQLHNVYNTVHTCKNNEIVVIYDGDDFLKDDSVLLHINKVYQDPNVWMTYGQYEVHPTGQKGQCQEIPDIVIDQNEFRSYKWVSSHLRTFYAGLFKQIKKEDLMHNNDFFHAATDMAAMFPMLEMAGKHAHFIPRTLYVHNQDNPLNQFKTELKLVLYLDRVARNKKRYDRLAALDVT